MKANQLQRGDKFVLVAHLQAVIAAAGEQCLVIYQVAFDPKSDDASIAVTCNGRQFGTVRANQDVIVCQE